MPSESTTGTPSVAAAISGSMAFMPPISATPTKNWRAARAASSPPIAASAASRTRVNASHTSLPAGSFSMSTDGAPMKPHGRTKPVSSCTTDGDTTRRRLPARSASLAFVAPMRALPPPPAPMMPAPSAMKSTSRSSSTQSPVASSTVGSTNARPAAAAVVEPFSSPAATASSAPDCATFRIPVAAATAADSAAAASESPSSPESSDACSSPPTMTTSAPSSASTPSAPAA
mmetsp:Transcript_24191/g.83995  ORF Transcript_24191/g.83995 Transcript_24191/m.83995 type:complete len:231 (+) Transcript_24191:900-1592(+)